MLKGAIRDCLHSLHSASGCLQLARHQTTETSCVNHVHPIVICEGDSSAIEFDRVGIALTFGLLFLWLKPLPKGRGEETGEPEKNPRRRTPGRSHILNPEDVNLHRKLNPHTGIGGRHTEGRQTFYPVHYTWPQPSVFIFVVMFSSNNVTLL